MWGENGVVNVWSTENLAEPVAELEVPPALAGDVRPCNPRHAIST